MAVCDFCGHQFCPQHRSLGWDRIKAMLRLRKPQCEKTMTQRFEAGGY